MIMSNNKITHFFTFTGTQMGKKPTRKRPYFTMKSAMTAILRDASGKMHHGILFDLRLDSGASWVIKFGKLSIRENLVMT